MNNPGSKSTKKKSPSKNLNAAKITKQGEKEQTSKITFKHFYKIWSYLWGVIGPIETIIFFYVNNLPQIAIVQNPKTNQPFNILFNLKNENYYSLNNVKVHCRILYYRVSDTTFFYIPDTLVNSNIPKTDTVESVKSEIWNIPTIKSHQQTIVHFKLKNFVINNLKTDPGRIKQMYIIIYIVFDPPIYFPFWKTKEFEFICEPNSKGIITCYPIA